MPLLYFAPCLGFMPNLKPHDLIFSLACGSPGGRWWREGRKKDFSHPSTPGLLHCHIFVTFLTTLTVKQKVYAWGGHWRWGLAPNKGMLDPSLCAKYRPGEKFEEVEKTTFIWSTLFFIPCSAWMCVQCLSEVTDSEWEEGSLYSLARIRKLQYMHHQSFTGVSVKNQKKKKAFLRLWCFLN